MNVVLHICCAVCAAGAAERLLSEGHQVHGFFYNPNIYPEDEYRRRLDSSVTVSQKLDFPISEGVYAPESWLSAVEHLKEEPEGGKRCEACFRYRLKETLHFMKECGADVFTTTLTIGPRKSASLIQQLGRDIGGDTFLFKDFKKKEGFARANELARTWGLHRQDYCGCLYSLNERDRRHTRI